MMMMIVPIVVILVGRVTVVSALHIQNAAPPNDRMMLTVIVMMMLMMIPIVVTLVGIVTDVSP
jgi:hypothetical protein